MKKVFPCRFVLKCAVIIIALIFSCQSKSHATGGPGVIVDTTPPVITLLGQVAVTHPAGPSYVDPGATASDNMDGNITADIITHNPVNSSIPGTYTLTYNVADSEGNSAPQVTRTVNVVDNTLPVISLLGDPTITLTVGTAYTDPGATAADDLDGNITASITAAGFVNTNAIGFYTIAYNVADSSGNAALEAVRTIYVVDGEKHAPIAHDGSLITDEDTPAGGWLIAEDEDNDDLTYSIIASGARGNAFLIDDTTGEFAYIPNPDTNGPDTVTFRVTDGQYNSNTASVSVTITPVNDAPVADAGPDQTLYENSVTATLSAANSTDADDDIDTYSWEQLSGPQVDLSGPDEAMPTFLLPDVNMGGASLSFRVTVKDRSDLQSQDTCIVNVTWTNIPPTADAGDDQAVGEGEAVYLDGSDSHDMDDGVSSFQWSQVSGPEVELTGAASTMPAFIAPDINSDTALAFQLTVTDTHGLQATDTCTVNISWLNTPPLADAGDDLTINEGESVLLDGSGSYDLDDGIKTYHWRQTAGIPSALSDPMISNPSIIAPDIGSGETVLTFELTVSDNTGLQSTDACTLTVMWVNEPPVSNAGPNRTVIEKDSITLDGTGSSDPDDVPGGEPDGGMDTYRWIQAAGVHVDIVNPETALPHFTAPSIDSHEEILAFTLTVTDGLGLASSDTVLITVADDSAEADSDGDGVPDFQDSFPSDPNEWFDNDQDGTGDNSDLDDDDDTMPDSWESANRLNPFDNDTLDDADGDGSSNLDEYLADTDPSDADSFPVITDQNTPPDQPELYWPADNSLDISLTPILQTSAFHDADAGDRHMKTEWQIAIDADFTALVFQRGARKRLTAVPVPPSVLKQGTEYYWRARFYDDYNGKSEWSKKAAFTTLMDETFDANENGIPDTQEVDGTVDLDENEIPDLSQDDISSLNHIVLNRQIGIKKYKNVIAIEAATILDLNNFPDLKNNPEDLPFGLISFRILVRNPGDVATIKICLSEPVPEEAVWYKYDALTGFYEYSDHVIMTRDRKCLIITLKDGGFGDDDGVENGIIVDPGALVLPSAVRETDDAAVQTELSEAAAGDTGGGCFIRSLLTGTLFTGR